MLKAVMRAFDSEIQEICTPFSPVSSYMPPTPITISDYSDLASSKVNIHSPKKNPSLDQLSSWRLEDSEWHLCHDVGCAPCLGSVDASIEEQVINYQSIQRPTADQSIAFHQRSPPLAAKSRYNPFIPGYLKDHTNLHNFTSCVQWLS